MPGKALGDRGERIAAAFLEGLGWTLLERNFRLGRNEIDLVARRGEVVAFVEVKTRAGPACGHPLEAITLNKRTAIARTAEEWVKSKGGVGDVYRFDAIAVEFRRAAPPVVDHVENAWWAGD